MQSTAGFDFGLSPQVYLGNTMGSNHGIMSAEVSNGARSAIKHDEIQDTRKMKNQHNFQHHPQRNPCTPLEKFVVHL